MTHLPDFGRTVVKSRTAEPAVRPHLILVVSQKTDIYRKNFTGPKEPDRKAETDSFMWLFRTGEDGLPPIILYGYTETHARYNAEAFLEGFSGYLMTDGYQGYNHLPGITRTCCWAHVRRYFHDAVPQGKKLDYAHPAVQGVVYCDKLFAIERYCKEHGFTAEQRHDYHLKKASPILAAFWSWLDKLKDCDSIISRSEKSCGSQRCERWKPQLCHNGEGLNGYGYVSCFMSSPDIIFKRDTSGFCHVI